VADLVEVNVSILEVITLGWDADDDDDQPQIRTNNGFGTFKSNTPAYTTTQNTTSHNNNSSDLSVKPQSGKTSNPAIDYEIATIDETFIKNQYENYKLY